jgi:hypothetical protein
MAEITITENWDKTRMKIKRRYKDLTEEDLQFTPGKEDLLIENLMKAIGQDRKYVVFMLKKIQLNNDTNRL